MSDSITKAVESTIKTAETDATTAVAAKVSFFERNPKIIAIGSAVVGCLITLAIMHFI